MTETITIGRQRVDISNPDRLYFPDDGITKGDLIDYYREVAETILPHVRGRPVTMHRWPEGLAAGGFIQQEIGEYYPDWIPRVTVKKAGGRVTHAVINNAATLVYLANQACITPHVWLSREDTLDHPDLMIFDLDPAGDDEFDVVRRAARSLRDLLKEVHLPAYLRTTGSRGLHVVVPLDRSEVFDTVREFARDLARVLEARDPTGLTTAPRKAKRRGRLFLDTARNAYAQTAVASYAVRAKPGAPVAAPVDWRELESGSFHAQKFTIKNIFRRLATAGDPWDQMWRQARSLRSPRRRLDALMAKAQKPL